MLIHELYHLRNPVIVVHCAANTLWQFLTLSPRIEKVFRVAAVATVMPFFFSALCDMALPEQRSYIMMTGVTVNVTATLTTMFSPKYTMLAQGLGLSAFLYCIFSVLDEMPVESRLAAPRFIWMFIAYATAFIIHKIGDAKSIPGLMDLTVELKHRYDGSWTGAALCFANMYDVSHWICVAMYFSISGVRQ